MQEVREVKYVGMDSFRRPIFQEAAYQGIKGYYYACLDKPVPHTEVLAFYQKKWVKKHIKATDLVCYGWTPECTPNGQKPHITLEIVDKFSSQASYLEVVFHGLDDMRHPVFVTRGSPSSKVECYGSATPVPARISGEKVSAYIKKIKAEDLLWFGPVFNTKKPAFLTPTTPLRIVEQFAALTEEQSKDLQCFQESATKAAAESAHFKLTAVAKELGLVFENCMAANYVEAIQKLKVVPSKTTTKATKAKLMGLLEHSQALADKYIKSNTEYAEENQKLTARLKKISDALGLDWRMCTDVDILSAIEKLKCGAHKTSGNVDFWQDLAAQVIGKPSGEITKEERRAVKFTAYDLLVNEDRKELKKQIKEFVKGVHQ